MNELESAKGSGGIQGNMRGGSCLQGAYRISDDTSPHVWRATDE